MNHAPTNPATARPTRIGPIEFAAGMTPLNAWTYVYQSFVTVALLSFLSFAQPYVLSEVLQVPPEQSGRVTGALITMQEILSLFLVGYIGGLSDRFGRRSLFVLGFAIMAVGFALFAFASSVPELFAYRFIYAVGCAITGVIFGVISADYPAETSRGKLAGLGGVLNGLGVALAAAAFSQLPAIATAVGYTSAEAAQLLLVAVGGLSLVTALIVGFGLKGGLPGQRRERATLVATLRTGFGEARRNRRIWLCYAGGFISRADLTLVATFVSLWLQQAGRNDGLTAEEALSRAGLLFALIQISSLFWAPVAGYLLDKFNRLASLTVALLLAGIGYTFLGLQEHPFEAGGLVGAVLVGIGQMSVILSANSLLGQETPVDVRGAVFGMNGVFGAAGILTTSLVGGYLFDHWRISGPVLFVGMANLAVFFYGVRLWIADGRPVRYDRTRIASGGSVLSDIAH